jgi:hypothetical protein
MQLFWVVFSTFCGQKKDLNLKKIYCSIRTRKLHNIKLRKKIYRLKIGKSVIHRAQLGKAYQLFFFVIEFSLLKDTLIHIKMTGKG